MSKTNSGLLAYAKAQLGLPYWYGTYGQTATAALYTAKKKQYPDNYTATDFSTQYGKRVHDCVGLIKGYLWSDSTTATPKYTAAQDKSAKGMYSAATNKGKIASIPNTPGILVFRGTSTSSISHVGIYGGDGYVYEAKGHAYGVVKSTYSASSWNYWAQCPYCEDDTSDNGTTTTADSNTSTTTESNTDTSTSDTSTTTTTATTNSKEVTATDAAKSKDSSLAGTYKTTANLYMRSGAGTGKKALVILPKSTTVKNYGYYTALNGVKWLYVQVTYKNIKYTGFCCGTYLSKQ